MADFPEAETHASRMVRIVNGPDLAQSLLWFVFSVVTRRRYGFGSVAEAHLMMLRERKKGVKKVPNWISRSPALVWLR